MHTVALIEPFWTGHPETQLKLFAEALLRRQDRRVVVFCQHPEALETWARSRSPEEAQRCKAARFAFCDERGTYPSTSLASWARLQEALTRAEAALGFPLDQLFITWLDLFICSHPDQATALMPRPWVGLYLFPSYLREQTLWSRLLRSVPHRRAKDRNFLRATRCKGVALLDEGVRKELASLIHPVPVHILPDVADTTWPDIAPAGSQWLVEKARGRPVVGLLGVLGRRKGTLAFLKAIKDINASQCFFLLAGRLGDEERKTYGNDLPLLDTLLAEAGARDNVYLHLKPLPDEPSFNSMVSACSVVYLAYDGHHHSSGLLAKAACFQKLVIAPDRGCVAERVRKYRLGLLISPRSGTEAVSAIRKLCTPAIHARYRNRARFDAYNSDVNLDTLERSLNALLGELK